MEVRVGKARIRVVLGDITEQDTDAIANAANDHLWMGSGVAGAIKSKGGEEIELEAMKQGPIPVGSAVITGAGRLPQRYVIHAAVMGQKLEATEDSIRDATCSALMLCEEKKISSVSLPAFGTGVGRFPAARCAEIMVDACIDTLLKTKNISEVRLVLFDKPTFDKFVSTLESRFKRR
ncbi:macro domain-containing protein [bacterium]|nr:macro domain-containing protein [bacterium]